ncbi:hypothetical protein GOBAR_AA16277 [Gossypium barbadense]|uniref:Transposase Tnp1/En/Spm-like domain-containing protein n=1 Tax=Gossypium barbadense TaxID=3634 RepID=A0A2P5XM09_GOSBA|nr:hypothetical protein GOBAR_AA16277 [Gossypium barbadense]
MRRRLRDLSIVQNTPNSEEGNSEQQTVVGSANVPETLDKPEEFQSNERFALKVSDDYIKRVLGKKWRDNKSTIKRQYFKKDISLEEKLRNVPPGMLKYQWENAVRSWNSKKGEQAKTKIHAHGRVRSFASVAEAEEVKSGQKIGRLQLFEITHRKKDGSPMTSETGEIMEKLKEKKVEYEVIASTDSSVNLENIDNRIITEVLGPERADAAEKEAATVAREAAATARKAEARAREAEAAAMAAEQSKKYFDLQLQLQQMMQMFQQS